VPRVRSLLPKRQSNKRIDLWILLGGGKALGVLYTEQCRLTGTRWLMGRSKLKALKETTLNTFFEQSTLLEINHKSIQL
jgi:hypothetical protein